MSDEPGHEAPPTPLWVKLFGAAAIVVVLLFVVLLIAGGHGPGRHTAPSASAHVGP